MYSWKTCLPITCTRVVTKISSCRVNTTSKRGIKRLGISFGSIFSPFSNKSSRGPLSQQPGKIPGPQLLMTILHVPSKLMKQTYTVLLCLQEHGVNFSFLSGNNNNQYQELHGISLLIAEIPECFQVPFHKCFYISG